MPVVKIAEVSFTSDDRVRDVIHNFNADGFDSLYPKYSGGWPKTFTLAVWTGCPSRSSWPRPSSRTVAEAASTT
ncbi:hypothetical protein PUR34_02215 [Streptomyces sp. JV185]|nr:hypothetical protein [Streptomyces sp. JV185]